jgi:hypothetical protein
MILSHKYLSSDLKNCSVIIRRESSCVQAEYQCKDGITCIHRSWVCDGEQDCPGGDDEKPPVCQNVTCRADQFQCADKTCIHGRFHCSGKAECKDGSDELNCRKKESQFSYQSINFQFIIFSPSPLHIYFF